MTTFTWHFNDTEDINSDIKFRYINTNSNLVSGDTTSYEISDESKLVYADLNSVHNANASYTLDFTFRDNDTSLDATYFTFGYHTRDRDTDAVTVGKSNGKPVLGIITSKSTIKATPEPTMPSITSDDFVHYRMIYNNNVHDVNKLQLYKINDSYDDSVLLCVASNLPVLDFSIPDAKILLGTTGWRNEYGYDEEFNVAQIECSNLGFWSGKSMYPPGSANSIHIGDILITNPDGSPLTTIGNTLPTQQTTIVDPVTGITRTTTSTTTDPITNTHIIELPDGTLINIQLDDGVISHPTNQPISSSAPGNSSTVSLPPPDNRNLTGDIHVPAVTDEINGQPLPSGTLKFTSDDVPPVIIYIKPDGTKIVIEDGIQTVHHPSGVTVSGPTSTGTNTNIPTVTTSPNGTIITSNPSNQIMYNGINYNVGSVTLPSGVVVTGVVHPTTGHLGSWRCSSA